MHPLEGVCRPVQTFRPFSLRACARAPTSSSLPYILTLIVIGLHSLHSLHSMSNPQSEPVLAVQTCADLLI